MIACRIAARNHGGATPAVPQTHLECGGGGEGGSAVNEILFGLFYVAAIAVVILHYTGWLAEHNLQWLAFLMAALVFPVVLLL